MKRYAIYFLPGGALGAAGAAWLGRDCISGARLSQPHCRGLSPAVQDSLTAPPRRYGFHATLKAPMVLADGVDEATLIAMSEAFAARHTVVNLGRLSPRWMGNFLALTPGTMADAADNALATFAFDVVRHFEPARAPLDTAAFDRRTKGLPTALVHHVEAWGYPYVGDAFRLHLTLSAPVDDAEKPVWLAAARDWFETALQTPVLIDAISVMVEADYPGDLQELHRLPLNG